MDNIVTWSALQGDGLERVQYGEGEIFIERLVDTTN